MKYQSSKFKLQPQSAEIKAMKLYVGCIFILGLASTTAQAQALPATPTSAGRDQAVLNHKLFNSLAKGDVLSVRVYLAKGAQPTGLDAKGRGPLHLAASMKDTKILTRFLDTTKTPINAVDHMGQSPLFEAVEAQHLPSVKLLVAKGARVDLRTRAFGDTLLHRAAALGQVEMIKFLVSQGLGVNTQDLVGNTPLHTAVAPQSLEALLSLGARMELKNILGETAFLKAARLGKVKAARHLIKKGTNLQALDEKKRTALQLAIENSHPSMVAVLASTGVYKKSMQKHLQISQARLKTVQLVADSLPKVKKSAPFNKASMALWKLGQAQYVHKILEQANLKPAKSQTAYQRVLEYLSPPVNAARPNTLGAVFDITPSLAKINTLMKPSFNLEDKSLAGNTPLLWSGLEGKFNSAQVLLQAGADIKAKNKTTGQNFLHLAASHQVDRDTMLWFINKANDKALSLDEGDRYGLTALHYAAANGRLEALELLRTHKTQAPTFFRSPLQLAALNGHLKIVKRLYTQKTYQTHNHPLALAASKGHYKIVDYLLGHSPSLLVNKQALIQARQAMQKAKKALPYNINQYNAYKIVIDSLQNFYKKTQNTQAQETKL